MLVTALLPAADTRSATFVGTMHGQRRINSPTQPGSPMKGRIVKAEADARGLPSPDTKQSQIGVGGPNESSHRESNVSRKRVLSQDTAGATKLKRLPTPTDLFEDECVFCHSFRTSEVIQFKSF